MQETSDTNLARQPLANDTLQKRHEVRQSIHAPEQHISASIDFLITDSQRDKEKESNLFIIRRLNGRLIKSEHFWLNLEALELSVVCTPPPQKKTVQKIKQHQNNINNSVIH